jgi:UDP-sugar transporter A1/2/3
MAAHMVQFALQPVVTREFLSKDEDKGMLVLLCELFKVLLTMLTWTATGAWGDALQGWSLRNSLVTAGVPALIYSTQNMLIQTAYQNMDGVSFNVINQTKFVFAALFLYLIYGHRQSFRQVVALGLIFGAAVLLTSNDGSSSSGGGGDDGSGSAASSASSPPLPARQNSFMLGYLPCATAAMLSGVASAYSENIFRTWKKNALMYTTELAVFSLVAVAVGGAVHSATAPGEFTMLSGLVGAFTKGNWRTLAPPLLNAAGGIVVGLLVKHAGVIHKGFATMGSSVSQSVSQ